MSWESNSQCGMENPYATTQQKISINNQISYGMNISGMVTDPTVVNPYEQNLYITPAQVVVDPFLPRSVTAVELDVAQELVWTGTDDGYLTGYRIEELDRNCAVQVFEARPRNAGRFKSLLSFEHGILSLSTNKLYLHSRGGILAGSYGSSLSPEAGFSGQNCASLNPYHTHVVSGGTSSKLFVYDLNHTAEPVSIVNVCGDLSEGLSSLAFVKRKNILCCGGVGGELCFIDMRLGSSVFQVKAHSGSLAMLAAQENVLVTCGSSLLASRPGDAYINSTTNGFNGKQMKRLTSDPSLNVYDVRMIPPRPRNPLTFSRGRVGIGGRGARVIQFIPGRRLQLMAASGSGIVKTFDLSGGFAPGAETDLSLTQGISLQSCSISSAGSVLAFGDSQGVVHLCTTASEENQDRDISGRILLPSINMNKWRAEDLPPIFTPPPSSVPPDCVHPAGEYDLLPHLGTMRRMPQQPSLLLSNPSPWLAKRIIAQKPARKISSIILDAVLPSQPGDYLSYVSNQTTKFKLGSLLHENSKVLTVSDPRNTSDSPRRRSLDAIDVHIPRVPLPENYKLVAISKEAVRFGMNNFDFGYYNDTRFAALENGFPNCYVCSEVQMLYHMPPLRSFLLGHLCAEPSCISCELAFLFDMLQQAQSAPPRVKSCQPTNFLRALRLIPEATALGLLDAVNRPSRLRLNKRIEALHEFLLEQVNKECGSSSIVKALMGTKLRMHARCSSGHCNIRDTTAVVTTLRYPEEKEDTKLSHKIVPFSEIFRASLAREMYQPRAWCEDCKKYMATKQKIRPQEMPVILSINASVTDQIREKFWMPGGKSWLPPFLAVSLKINEEEAKESHEAPKKELDTLSARISQKIRRRESSEGASVSEVYVTEGSTMEEAISNLAELDGRGFVFSPTKTNGSQDEKLNEPLNVMKTPAKVPLPAKADDDGTSGTSFDQGPTRRVYQLQSIISMVNDRPGSQNTRRGHLVLHTKTDGQWLMFNDFRIVEQTEEEVLNFSFPWRTPCILTYRALDKEWYSKEMIAASISPFKPQLYGDVKGPLTNRGLDTPISKMATAFLSNNEIDIPSKGDLIAIDCEFVALTEEKFEITSQGKRVVQRAADLSLGRVSILDGRRPGGKPFIDDYIIQPEPVVDHLSKFSGLHEGDLDPTVSSHPLIPLKAAYLKLRHLIDRGCVMVGHGLKKDFRIANIYVPEKQVRDTVELFKLPGQRFISLRFLAAYLLNWNVQSDEHDSIDDARAALLLFQKYEELKEKGLLQSTLHSIYEEGHKSKWKKANGILLT
eukprot:g2694.t1